MKPFFKQVSALIFAFYLGQGTALAQFDEEIQSNQTNGQIDYSKSPLTIQQTNWVIKHGFNAAAYQWDDAAINRQLKGAVGLRNVGRTITVIGLGIAGVGVMQYAGGIFKEDQIQSNQETSNAGEILVLSGIVLSGSFIITIGAQGKVKKADKLRLSRSK